MKSGNLHPWSLARALRLRSKSWHEIEKVQHSLLAEHLAFAARSPFYSNRFAACGFDPEAPLDLKAFQDLPFTERQDLEENSPDFIACDDIVPADISQTSGTTGRPLSVPLTLSDIDRLAFNEALALHGAGVKPGDRVVVAVTMDRCFIAGLAYHSGVVRLGATALRAGPGGAAMLWELVRQFMPRVVIGVPSMLLETAGWIAERGVELAAGGIETVVAIGEPVRNAHLELLPLGKALASAWGCRIASTYAATEMQTCFCECVYGAGGHVHPELMYVEVVDAHGRPVAPGEPGEVVVTPLGVEGVPLVRYRTGDVARLFDAPCRCGWNTPRLGPVEGRLAHRLKFRGTTLYPEMIFHVLQEVSQVGAAYIEVRADFDLSDHVTVVVGVKEEGAIDREQLLSLIQARIRVKPDMRIEALESVKKRMFEHGGRKPKRFFDYRQASA